MAEVPANITNDTLPAVDFSDKEVFDLAAEPEESDDDYPEDYPDYFPFGVLPSLNTIIEERREDTRGRLAIIYTVATFLMFILGFVVAVLDAYWRQSSIIDNLSTILPLLSGIFLGSLGFVLGYYFRKIESEEREQK